MDPKSKITVLSYLLRWNRGLPEFIKIEAFFFMDDVPIYRILPSTGIMKF